MSRILMLMLTLLPFVVQAAGMHRCVSADGVISFQANRCAADQEPADEKIQERNRQMKEKDPNWVQGGTSVVGAPASMRRPAPVSRSQGSPSVSTDPLGEARARQQEFFDKQAKQAEKMRDAPKMSIEQAKQAARDREGL